MSRPLPPLPPGYTPPVPCADICPACKKQHARNAYTFRDGPVGLGPNGGYVDREYGFFCKPCETAPVLGALVTPRIRCCKCHKTPFDGAHLRKIGPSWFVCQPCLRAPKNKLVEPQNSV